MRLPDALHSQIPLSESPELVVIESRATTPLGALLRDLLLQRAGVDGTRIIVRRLLDENPVLRALLGCGAQAPGALRKGRDTLPLWVPADASEFLADQLFGNKLAVYQVGHRLRGQVQQDGDAA